MSPSTPAPSAGRAERLAVVLLAVLGVYELGLAVLQLVAPGTFFEQIGPFGERNDHYIRDTATFYMAFGALALGAVRYASWRVPALAAHAVQYALHSANHLLDIDEADPKWVGYFDFFALAAITALLVVALLATRPRDRGASP